MCVCFGVFGGKLVEDAEGSCARFVRQAVFHGVRWRRWKYVLRITKIDTSIGKETVVIRLVVWILVNEFSPRLFSCLCPFLQLCIVRVRGRLEFSVQTCLYAGSGDRPGCPWMLTSGFCDCGMIDQHSILCLFIQHGQGCLKVSQLFQYADVEKDEFAVLGVAGGNVLG